MGVKVGHTHMKLKGCEGLATPTVWIEKGNGASCACYRLWVGMIGWIKGEKEEVSMTEHVRVGGVIAGFVWK